MRLTEEIANKLNYTDVQQTFYKEVLHTKYTPDQFRLWLKMDDDIVLCQEELNTAYKASYEEHKREQLSFDCIS